MTRLIHFLRTGDEVVESTVRGLYDAMREKNAQRATLVASTQNRRCQPSVCRDAADYRPRP